MARIKDVEQRALVIKSVLEIMRLYSAAYLKSGRFGSSADDLALCGAIFIGQAEGRPMNASKLAHFAGLPRPTVIRKMQRLTAAGVLEKRGDLYLVREEVANSVEVTDAAQRASKQLMKAVDGLSKLDTKRIVSQCGKGVAMLAVILSESLEYWLTAGVLLTNLHGI